MIIDLRSDTLTVPSAPMLEAMFAAQVGDDVFAEDPTVNALEKMAANLFNKEAALYCPSGTMSNQIAIKCHTQPGDEVICEKNSHIYLYEGGGIARNAGAQVQLIAGDFGRITAAQVAAAINPDEVYRARTKLVSLENTTNRGSGSCYQFTAIEAIKNVCRKNGLALHLDGARLFNALVAKKETTQQYGAVFDSISICLNKGLGCPIGSILIGDSAFIKEARRVRKVFGGGMRQAGYMAAAGIYALQNNIERLAEDHLHAQQIAAALANKNFTGKILPVETNIIIVEVVEPFTAKALAALLTEKGVKCFAMSETQIRLVTHLNITAAMVEKAITIINAL
jgi:threonine aldolase